MGYIGRDFESHPGWCGIVAWQLLASWYVRPSHWCHRSLRGPGLLGEIRVRSRKLTWKYLSETAHSPAYSYSPIWTTLTLIQLYCTNDNLGVNRGPLISPLRLYIYYSIYTLSYLSLLGQLE